jgi:probable DNA metabolism protein
MSSSNSKFSSSCQLKGYKKEEIFHLIHRHAQYSNNLATRIKAIPESILKNIASPEARKIDRMIREIFRELERVKQFTRTKLNNHGILYGKILITHKIEDLVLEYFHKRFPDFWICLYNEKKRQTLVQKKKGEFSYWDLSLEESVKKLSLERPIKPYFDDIQIENEDLFNTFYASQYISSRKNPRYYQQMIPKKLFNLPGLRGSIEGSLENTKLDQYFKKKKVKHNN